MLLSALGVLFLGIYVNNWQVMLASVGLLLLAVAFHLVEKRSQDPRR